MLSVLDRPARPGDARALAANTEPLAVAVDKDVHVPRDDLRRFPLDGTGHPLREPHDSRIPVDLDGELVDGPLIDLAVERLHEFQLPCPVAALTIAIGGNELRGEHAVDERDVVV